MKYVNAAILCSVLSTSVLCQQEDPSVLSRYNNALDHLVLDECSDAITDFQYAAANAVTPIYRVASWAGNILAHVECEQYVAAITLADMVLSSPDAQNSQVWPVLVDIVLHKSVAYREQGNLAQAISIRNAAITQWGGSLDGDDVYQLYIENSTDELGRDDVAASNTWYDRLFTEHPNYGLQDELRESHRINALIATGHSREDTSYRDRALHLAELPGLDDGRASAWLYAEAYYSAVIDQDINLRRDIALRMYYGSLLYDWHKPHDQQKLPLLKSAEITKLCRSAVLGVMIDVALLEPTDPLDLEDNYNYAKLVVDHMSDMEDSKSHLAKMNTIIRRYELQSGVSN